MSKAIPCVAAIIWLGVAWLGVATAGERPAAGRERQAAERLFQRLDLNGTHVSSEQVQALGQALPKCQIDLE